MATNPDSPGNSLSSSDLDSLQSQILAEAQRWRREYPEIRNLEALIANTWASIAPPGTATDEPGRALDGIESLSEIPLLLPDDSNRIKRFIKRAIHKTIGWHVHQITKGIARFGRFLTKYLRTIEVRLDHVERLNEVNLCELYDIIPQPQPSDSVARAIAQIVGKSKSVVISCGKGTIVNHIENLGGKAYGVDNDSPSVLEGTLQGLDLRIENPFLHLHQSTPGEHDAIVLSGAIQYLTLPCILLLVKDAHRVLADQGTLIVATGDPASRNDVDKELLSGRGLSPTAWIYLLRNLDFSAELIHTEDNHFADLVVARKL